MAFVQDDAGSVADLGTLAFTVNLGTNALLIAGIRFASNATSVTGITDTLGNTWALGVRNGNAADIGASEIWFAQSPNGGANTCTFDWSGTATGQVMIAEFDSFSGGAAKDQSQIENETLADHDAGTITTTQATSVIIFNDAMGSVFSVSSYGTGWAALTDNGRRASAFKITSATETTGTAITFGASEVARAAIANFYATGGAAFGWSPNMMLTGVM